MNETVPKAVCTTSLPYIDRRSLSEAWFSALHMASDGPALAGAPERRAPCASDAASLRPASPDADTAQASVGRQVLRTRPASRSETPAAGGAAAAARRPARVRTTRASDARAGGRSYPPYRTSLTLGVERQRVQLLLRRDGGTLHVVALCSSCVAPLVRRALACADAHLRGRGEAVRSSVHVVGLGELRA